MVIRILWTKSLEVLSIHAWMCGSPGEEPDMIPLNTLTFKRCSTKLSLRMRLVCSRGVTLVRLTWGADIYGHVCHWWADKILTNLERLTQQGCLFSRS